jgi:L,D-transpeptidase catalytic domain
MMNKNCVGKCQHPMELLPLPFPTKYTYTLRALLPILILLVISSCVSTTNIHPYNKPNPLPLPLLLKQQGEVQLQTYAQWIKLLKRSGGQITPYHHQYALDALSLALAKSKQVYLEKLATLRAHVLAIQMPAFRAEAQQLQQHLQQEATGWGQSHTFYNPPDAINYPLGYEYAENGIGGWIQGGIAAAQTPADYQQVIEDIHMYMTNFRAMQKNASDQTPFNQVHQTDLQLMQQYHKTGKTLVISLGEQAMRVYDQRQLVNAFLVTTGRPDRPTPPGVWWVEGRLSPTIFKSGVPRSSPDWYPNTPIHYALQYHSNGYFIHDSWWRNDYGPGTNYPHADSSHNAFSAQGSHGCVNISLANAAWLYSYAGLYTSIIIY